MDKNRILTWSDSPGIFAEKNQEKFQNWSRILFNFVEWVRTYSALTVKIQRKKNARALHRCRVRVGNSACLQGVSLICV